LFFATHQIAGSPAVLARPVVRTCSSIVFQGNVLFKTWPTLHGVLPPEIFLKVRAQRHALRKASQSLGAGAISSSWIGVFGADGSPEFTLELVPALFGYSRHPLLPVPYVFDGLRLRVSVLVHVACLSSKSTGRDAKPLHARFCFSGDFDYTF